MASLIKVTKDGNLEHKIVTLSHVDVYENGTVGIKVPYYTNDLGFKIEMLQIQLTTKQEAQEFAARIMSAITG
ncbi:MAG TPA: hypothetical protein VHT24_16290 [Pseudacidobacterium sp.]|jgi:hypothetical protein|nr:hypothetical protein [Pseudacidobacterium sp.]